MDIRRAASAIEYAHIELEDILAAFEVLDGAIEDDYPWNEQDNASLAKHFAKNFPLFLSTYRIIRRDLYRVTNDLKAACDSAYKAIRAEEKSEAHGAKE